VHALGRAHLLAVELVNGFREHLVDTDRVGECDEAEATANRSSFTPCAHTSWCNVDTLQILMTVLPNALYTRVRERSNTFYTYKIVLIRERAHAGLFIFDHNCVANRTVALCTQPHPTAGLFTHLSKRCAYNLPPASKIGVSREMRARGKRALIYHKLRLEVTA
jgi:hypothetical protein